jgi:hypothetical protein
MSKFVTLTAALAFIAGAATLVPAPAQARYWHHGGGWGYRGFGLGPAWGLGWGPAYPYYGPYYAGPVPGCSYVNVPAWRHGYRVWRRVWRCG